MGGDGEVWRPRALFHPVYIYTHLVCMSELVIAHLRSLACLQSHLLAVAPDPSHKSYHVFLSCESSREKSLCARHICGISCVNSTATTHECAPGATRHGLRGNTAHKTHTHTAS